MSSEDEAQQLADRLRASRLRYHYHCGGEIIGKPRMQCGATGDYFWALDADGKYATTEELYLACKGILVSISVPREFSR